MRRAVIPVLALALPHLAAAACPATPAELEATLLSAEDAFAQMDATGFAAQRDLAREQLACLTEVIAPTQAARVHHVEALSLFLDRNLDGVAIELRSALASDPSFALPESYAPPGGPLHSALEAARTTEPGAPVPLPEAEGFAWFVDGGETVARPGDRPIVLQRTGGDALRSAYLGAGGDLPAWPTDAVVATGPEPVAHGAGDAKKGATLSSTTMQIGAASGTALLVSGGLFAAAFSQEARFHNDDGLTFADRQDLQKKTNNLGFAAQGVGLVGLGLGGVAVWSTRW